MSAFPFTDQSRIRRRRHYGLSFPLLLSLAVASALTGAVVALVVQRLLHGAQYIDVLPQPPPVRHLQDASAPSESSETAREASVAPDLAERAGPAPSRVPASPLGAVAAGLSMKRAAELGQVAETDDDVVMGDGSPDCPDEFPVKGNGRSGIYHWPGASAYQQTTPTLCFRSPEAAERAGFRAAKR